MRRGRTCSRESSSRQVPVLRFVAIEASSRRCAGRCGLEDWILCQVTSKAYGDTRAILLQDGGFESGSLRIDSYVRPGKLFTAYQTLMVSESGRLKEATFQQIVDAIVALLKPVLKQSQETDPTA